MRRRINRAPAGTSRLRLRPNVCGLHASRVAACMCRSVGPLASRQIDQRGRRAVWVEAKHPQVGHSVAAGHSGC